MSYVVPNSQVQLFKGVPLNKDSEDTIYFSSVKEQDNYFNSAVTATFSASNFAFIKKDKQTIRVDAGYSDVYQSNYLRFNNTESGNKWFYAFITDVIYVNDGVTEIQYEIDVMQTWLPNVDYVLTQCYVDREHSSTDVFGENILNEGLDLGELIDEQIHELNFTPKYLAVMLAANDSIIPLIPTVVYNSYYDLIPCGYIIVLFDMGSESSLQTLPKFVSDASLTGNIMGCYTIPTGILSEVDLGAFELTTDTTTYNAVYVKAIVADKETITIGRFADNVGHIDGYAPKNKKLFTFPYNRLLVTNSKGSQEEFKFENFKVGSDENAIEFMRYASLTPPMTACIIPKDYADRNGGASTFHDGCKLKNKISMSISAVGGYTSDLYQANLMQQLPNVLSTVSGIAGASVTGGLSLVGTIQGGSQLISQLGQNDASTTKNSNPDNIDVANSLVSFDFFRRTIKASTAERIDNYFNAYGYRTDAIKVPNINARQGWTYTKTSGANFRSVRVPAGDMVLIHKKFDSGVRFHKNASTIGYTNRENPTL